MSQALPLGHYIILRGEHQHTCCCDIVPCLFLISSSLPLHKLSRCLSNGAEVSQDISTHYRQGFHPRIINFNLGLVLDFPRSQQVFQDRDQDFSSHSLLASLETKDSNHSRPVFNLELVDFPSSSHRYHRCRLCRTISTVDSTDRISRRAEVSSTNLNLLSPSCRLTHF